MTAPMTAAEYREANRTALGMYPGGWTVRILAALEEREALLGERGIFAEDASLGALVRRIREHPMVEGAALTIRTKIAKYGGDASLLFDSSLAKALSRLDSLLPKEPEVVVGKSGRKYRVNGDGKIEHTMNEVFWAFADEIPLADAPVVAALMKEVG